MLKKKSKLYKDKEFVPYFDYNTNLNKRYGGDYYEQYEVINI